jgi:hypothetical protein
LLVAATPAWRGTKNERAGPGAGEAGRQTADLQNHYQCGGSDHQGHQLPTSEWRDKIDFRGTPLMPAAHGEAKVESKQG